MLMRTDPFNELDRISRRLLGSAPEAVAMPMDAYRRGDEFVVDFDLPGVSADSIDVTVQRNVLNVHATRKRNDGEKVEMLAAERPFGTFSRQLFLGETLDVDRLEADYKDGVLRLRIPVAEQAKPRKVEIHGSSTTQAINADSSESAKAGA